MSGRPPISHAQLAAWQAAQEAHFVKRARQRFGLRVTPARYRRLIAKITEDQPGTRFLGHTPPNRTAWRIRFEGRWLRVVFDHVTERLVTCLPYGDVLYPRPRPNPHKLRRLRRERKARPWPS